MPSIEIRGAREIAAALRGRADALRRSTVQGVEVVPAAGDEMKAAALVATGRDVFATDDALRSRLVAIGESELGVIFERLETGRPATLTTIFRRWGDELLRTVRGRLNDQEPTPGGKRELSPAYARAKVRAGFSAHPIGKRTGALLNGLVRRFIGGAG